MHFNILAVSALAGIAAASHPRGLRFRRHDGHEHQTNVTLPEDNGAPKFSLHGTGSTPPATSSVSSFVAEVSALPYGPTNVSISDGETEKVPIRPGNVTLPGNGTVPIYSNQTTVTSIIVETNVNNVLTTITASDETVTSVIEVTATETKYVCYTPGPGGKLEPVPEVTAAPGKGAVVAPIAGSEGESPAVVAGPKSTSTGTVTVTVTRSPGAIANPVAVGTGAAAPAIGQGSGGGSGECAAGGAAPVYVTVTEKATVTETTTVTPGVEAVPVKETPAPPKNAAPSSVAPEPIFAVPSNSTGNIRPGPSGGPYRNETTSQVPSASPVPLIDPASNSTSSAVESASFSSTLVIETPAPQFSVPAPESSPASSSSSEEVSYVIATSIVPVVPVPETAAPAPEQTPPYRR